jgi:hypothetical protein
MATKYWRRGLKSPAGYGLLDENYPAIEAISRPGAVSPSFDALTENNCPLKKLLYSGRMMVLYERLLGGAVRHYDFTWLSSAKSDGKTGMAGCPATLYCCAKSSAGAG